MTTEFMRMFPLNNVLFPHTLLPLRIFEPRYLQMISECEDGALPFGVVLIERGFEVGGGDSRFSIGTAATVIESAELPGGHRAVIAAGTVRFEIEEWLAEDPYPAAMVRVLEEVDGPDFIPDAAEVAEAGRLLRRVFALASEMGQDVGTIQYQLAPDPIAAVYQLAGLAPIGPLDAQNILEAGHPKARLGLVRQALSDEAELLLTRLGGA